MYFFIGTGLHIYWSCHLQSSKCNWKKTGSNEPSCFLFFVCLCIVFVCAEKSILFPQPKKHLLWIVYRVPCIKAWLLSQKWLQKWHHRACCLFSLSPCLGDLLEHIFSAQLPVLQSPAVSRKIRALWTLQGQVHDVVGKLRAGSTLKHPLCFPPLDHDCGWLLKGTHRAPSSCLFFGFSFFFFLWSNPSFLLFSPVLEIR